VTQSAPRKHRRRKRLACGHLQELRYKIFCQSCYEQTPENRASKQRYKKSALGRASNYRYDHSVKGRKRYSRMYYKQRFMGLSAYVAKRVVVPGNTEETQRRLAQVRKVNLMASKRFYNRWGNLSRNPRHRHRWEMIREGKWKEKEHPL